MEKLKRSVRLAILIFLIVLASVGMSITGAAPVQPRHKETIMEDETRILKEISGEKIEVKEEDDEKP